MIHDNYLPMYLWAEASNIVIYVKNRSPHRILGNNILKDSFTSVKLQVSYLRIFGFPLYSLILKGKKSKMKTFGKKGTLGI